MASHVDLTAHVHADIEIAEALARMVPACRELEQQLPAVIEAFQRAVQQCQVPQEYADQAHATILGLQGFLVAARGLVVMAEHCTREANLAREQLHVPEGTSRH